MVSSIRQVAYQISIDGKDVSVDLDPILISLSLKMSDDSEAQELALNLSDADGQIELPSTGADVEAAIWWQSDADPVATTFEGILDEVKSSFSRSEGLNLSVSAKSADNKGKLKEPFSRHMDDASFGDVARKFGQDAGLSDVQVDSELASIHRSYWSIHNESFTTWGARKAEEMGASFHVFKDVAVFASRAGGQSVTGQDLPQVPVTWGVNVISGTISPILSRPDYGSFQTRGYDPQAAEHFSEGADDSDDGSSGTADSAQHTHLWKSPDRDHAKRQSGSNKTESSREKGGGETVTIDGCPEAQPGAMAVVSGIRPGVDGVYLISSVTHTINRSAGFTTELTLKLPSGDAGQDSRGSESSASGQGSQSAASEGTAVAGV